VRLAPQEKNDRQATTNQSLTMAEIVAVCCQKHVLDQTLLLRGSHWVFRQVCNGWSRGGHDPTSNGEDTMVKVPISLLFGLFDHPNDDILCRLRRILHRNRESLRPLYT
jgi:hypothetical protein